MAVKRELLIRYDEDAGKIVFFSVANLEASNQGKRLELKEIFGVDVEQLKKQDVTEAEQTVGAFIFSFLDRESTAGLGLRDYAAYQKEIGAEAFDQMLQTVDRKNPKDQLMLAISYIARGTQENCWADIETGEAWLQKAIESGYQEALAYQTQTWVIIKPRLEQRIKASGPTTDKN